MHVEFQSSIMRLYTKHKVGGRGLLNVKTIIQDETDGKVRTSGTQRMVCLVNTTGSRNLRKSEITLQMEKVSVTEKPASGWTKLD